MNNFFLLNHNAQRVILVFSYLGMTPKEVTANTSKINVVLESDTSKLDEVVVTALGISREKKTLTYAAQEVKGDEMTRVKDVSPLNTLSGKVAGLTVNRSSSGAGGSVKVTIRGNSSTTNNQPLYVINGIPMLNTNGTQPNSSFGDPNSGNTETGDVVSLLNPDDIESITLLKGANASALYGNQGANGVIVITTKQGKTGETAVKISSNTTLDQAAYFPEFDDVSEKRVKDFFRTGLTQITSVALSTGTEKMTNYISYSNTQSSGIMPTNDLSRHNFKVRVTKKLFKDKLTADASATFTTQHTINRPTNAYYFNPLTGLYGYIDTADFSTYKDNFEVFDPTRNLQTQNWYKNRDAEQNPYWILNRNKTTTENNRTLLMGSLIYKPLDWLTVKSRLSYDTYTTLFDRKVYAGTQTTLSHTNGKYILRNSRNSQLYTDLIASGVKQLNDDFDLSIILGTSLTQSNLGDATSLDSGISTGLKYANIFTLANFTATTGLLQTSGTKKEIQSIFGSASLGFRKHLYLDISARNDWSSTLINTENPSIFYPSLGLSAILSDVFEMPREISLLKVRGSYAVVGKDIPSFVSTPQSSIVAGNIIPPETGPSPTQPLRPERQSSIEFGLESAFFANRVNLSVTYYDSTTENQYLSIAAPAANPFGYSNYAFSSGSISNKGLEVVLRGTPIKTDKVSWSTNFNFATNKSLVTDLPESLGDLLILTSPGVNSYRYVLKKGKPFGVIQGKDLNRDNDGDPVITEDGGVTVNDDWVDVGNTIPDFTLGWSNTVTYKDLTLNFLIDSRAGGSVMSFTQGGLDSAGTSKVFADALANGGVDVAGQKLDAAKYYGTVGGDYGRNGASAEYMYSATNVSLRELSLGYKFKLKNNFIKAANVSLIARNLLFLYREAPFDPTVSLSSGTGLQGIDIYGLPSTRNFGVNISLTF